MRGVKIELNELASKENDGTTSNLAQDKIAELEKALWMLDNALESACKKKRVKPDFRVKL